MRVGIYNRWLATLGGGERYSLAVAEYLSRHHSVTVISHRPVTTEMVTTRLGLDLSGVSFVTIPWRAPQDITPFTAAYDLFISASHGDYFPSLARRSVLIVYFPAPLAPESPGRRLRRAIKIALRRMMMLPSFDEGTYSVEPAAGSQLRMTGSPVRVKMPPSRRGYVLTFDLASRAAAVGQAKVSLDGQSACAVDLPDDQSCVPCRIVVPGTKGGAGCELCIEAVRGAPAAQAGDDSPYQMALARFEILHPRYRLYRRLFEQRFPQWGLSLHYVPPRQLPILESLGTYHSIWAISQFTRQWIEKYWGRSSLVLYPPVDVESCWPGPKRSLILNVGRFLAESHLDKKQRVMIAAFKEMVDAGLEGWELHLAGGTVQGHENERYLQQLHEEAQAHPILIHPDIPFEELLALYSASAIYWHAAGYGEDEERRPAKAEHFGITTVEAMAAGAVPVVIAKGGQPEIVAHGQNGFLWHTTDELKNLTWRLIRSPASRQRLADAAVWDSRRFDKAHFHARLEELLRLEGLEPPGPAGSPAAPEAAP